MDFTPILTFPHQGGRDKGLAIVAAFRQEIGGFLKAGRFREAARGGRLRFYESPTLPSVAVAVGGFGRDGAVESVRGTVAAFSPEVIVCAGFSGGAVDGLATGDVVVGSRALAVEGAPDAWTPPEETIWARALETDRRSLEAIMDANAEYSLAPCLTAPAFVSDPATKRRLGGAFGASAIDMESYWAMEEAYRLGVPCVPVRVILDPVDQRVSRLVEDTLEDAPLRRALRSVGYVATHPQETPELLRLSSQVRRASAALGEFLMDAVR